MTIRLRGLIGFAIYLAIGALLHAMFIGPHFDWTSAWTFGWLLGWPVMLILTFSVFVIGLALITIVVVPIWMGINEWRDRRRRKALLAARKMPR